MYTAFIFVTDAVRGTNYNAAFYNVGDGAIEKYIAAMKEIYPTLEQAWNSYQEAGFTYIGDDENGKNVVITTYPETNGISVTVN
jgi:hypothetical protein